MKLHIVMYHYVRNLAASRYPRIKGLDLDLFRRQVMFLKENFNIISCEQLLEAAAGGACFPDNSVLLTFDDGYIDFYVFDEFKNFEATMYAANRYLLASDKVGIVLVYRKHAYNDTDILLWTERSMGRIYLWDNEMIAGMITNALTMPQSSLA